MDKVVITEKDWHAANDPEMMKIYKEDFPDAWNAMLRYMRKYQPRMCCECMLYYHLKDKDGKIYGGGCTADPDIMIMDMNKRAEDCPL